MQDIHSMSGAAGRIYGGDRRMRPHPHQALKCPRCDSLNTKFCYYNNYNLSQPRHFCKSCRRYWTKGGVLRNVPVGGGCRKTKRSKPKSTGADDTSTAANDVTPSRRDRKPTTASHSSSESSSLTATAAAGTADGAASVASSASGPPASAPTSALLNFPDSALFQNPIATSANSSTPFETAAPLIDDSAIFSEAGSFTNLMTASNPSLLGFNFVDIGASGPFRYQQQQKMVGLMEDMKMQELTTGFMDQTVSVELPPLQNRGASGGLMALDWQSNGDEGLFDLAGGVVDQGYWAHSQWADNDQTLYLP